MNDIFDETEENLRADQWVAIVKKALPWVSLLLGAALVVALGIWGWDLVKTHQSGKASEIYEAGVEAKVKGDTATAKTKLQAAVTAGNPNYKAMALMELAALAQGDNNNSEALKDLDDAAHATSDPILSDTAAYKAALLAMDTQSLDDVKTRLTPLTADKRPLSALAKEALALTKLQGGDTAGARADLQMLTLNLDAPANIKQRAQAEIYAIDSGAMPVALASLKLPEAKPPVMPAIDPAQLQQMQQAQQAQQAQ